MQKIDLYRYEESNGMVTVTPNKRNETDIPSRMRLIADENAILTDGTVETPVVDVMLDEVDKWTEIGGAIEEEAALKSQAYDILMGVSK
jgi:hypothetical protein